MSFKWNAKVNIKMIMQSICVLSHSKNLSLISLKTIILVPDVLITKCSCLVNMSFCSG